MSQVERVQLGAYYTDGKRLVEVVRVLPSGIGYVYIEDCLTYDCFGYGISAFRKDWWLVRGPEMEE